MRKNEILVEWHCNIDECDFEFETVEKIIEWENGVCYVICPSCGVGLRQKDALPIIKQKGNNEKTLTDEDIMNDEYFDYSED